MQVVLVVCVALVASCYSPSIRDCMLTCADGNKCPTGLECHDNYCREPGATDSCLVADAAPDMDGPDVDTDMDGFNDGVDNCPAKANADQANEDRDGFGDACDPCPPFGESADNHDTDGDGVGDGCDPFPDQVGERIALFVGFASGQPATEVERVGQTGAWSFNNERARVTTDPDSFAGLVWNLTPAADTRFYVASHVELLSFRPSNMARGAGVVVSYSGDNFQSAACVLGLNATGGEPSQMLLATELASDTIVSQMPNTVGAGQGMSSDIRVHRERGTTTFLCATPSTTIFGTPPVPGPNGRPGLRARGVTAEFDWVMVVEASP